VIENPTALAAWQAEVQAGFHPVPWSQTALAVGAAFGLEPARCLHRDAASV